MLNSTQLVLPYCRRERVRAWGCVRGDNGRTSGSFPHALKENPGRFCATPGGQRPCTTGGRFARRLSAVRTFATPSISRPQAPAGKARSGWAKVGGGGVGESTG